MYGSRKANCRIQPHLLSTAPVQHTSGSRVLSQVVLLQPLEYRNGVCTFTFASGLLLPAPSCHRNMLASTSPNRALQVLMIIMVYSYTHINSCAFALLLRTYGSRQGGSTVSTQIHSRCILNKYNTHMHAMHNIILSVCRKN